MKPGTKDSKTVSGACKSLFANIWLVQKLKSVCIWDHLIHFHSKYCTTVSNPVSTNVIMIV